MGDIMENMLEHININLLIAIGIGLLILIVILSMIVNSSKKNSRIKQLDDFQDRISTLKALPVQYLLNKVSLMPKTPEVADQFEAWNSSYTRLTGAQSTEIKNQIDEIESQVYARKYKLASDGIKDLSGKISAYENEYQALLDDLTKATVVDVKNREELTNQKELFRNYKKMYQSNSENYKPYNLAIEKYFNNIENAFTNIETLLNQSQVDKARNKGAALDGELLKMKDILNNLPGVLEELQKDLPARYQKVQQHYNNVISQNYNVSHLEVSKQLEEVKREIVDVLKNNNDVFLKDLQDVTHECYAKLDGIDKALDNEVRANEVMNSEIDKLVNVHMDAKAKVDKANDELNQIKDQYILTKNEQANLQMETDLLDHFTTEKNAIVGAKESNNYIASDLVDKASALTPKLLTLTTAVDAYIRHIDSMRADEKRQYDEYQNMQYIINETQAKLREMNLPKLSSAYFDTIEKCKKGLQECLVLLNQKPLNINAVNVELAQNQANVYKLYDNSRNLIKTAQMAENAIVFGNRYRSSRPEIESGLSRAETLFNNGEYTKSLSSAIESIETIYPKIRQELLNYKKDQSSIVDKELDTQEAIIEENTSPFKETGFLKALKLKDKK